MTLKDLAVDHPYFCSESNYYSNDAGRTWETWEEFYSEFGTADVDGNLCFRWDIDWNNGYFMRVFIIHQGKGIFSPHLIKSVKESDVSQIQEYLEQHLERMVELWSPLDMISKIRGKKLEILGI